MRDMLCQPRFTRGVASLFTCRGLLHGRDCATACRPQLVNDTQAVYVYTPVCRDLRRASDEHGPSSCEGEARERNRERSREKGYRRTWVPCLCTRRREQVTLSARGQGGKHNTCRFPWYVASRAMGAGWPSCHVGGYMHRGRGAGAGIIRRIPRHPCSAVPIPNRKSGPGRHGKMPTTLRKRH